MQEEVENRTVNIVVMTTRLTARSMIDGLRKYMNEQSQMKQHARQKKQDVKLESKYRQKEQRKAEGPHGKQTVKQLAAQNQGLMTVEITESIRTFDRVARKYGVDYAVKKDKTLEPPKYLVFFKAKDADALDAAFKDYTKNNDRNKERKASVLEKLSKAKAAIKELPTKVKHKELER